MKDITSLQMYQNPQWYDAVYCRSDRGKDKYSQEIIRINNLVKTIGLSKFVLDVGCGTGSHLYQMSELGYKGWGLDINPKMIECAKEKNQGLPYNFILANMKDFNLKKQFPLILCMYGAFNYLPDKKAVNETITCFYKHLTNEGVLIIDSRWAKNQPKGVMVENRSGGIYIAREWGLKHDSSMHAIYKVAFIKEGDEGMLIYEEHPQNFCDPFYLKGELERSGFKNVKVCDNFDFDSEISEDSCAWRTVIWARKQ